MPEQVLRDLLRRGLASILPIMPLPLIPVLKLLALGSLKIIVLGIGALIVPVFTVKLVVGGMGESVKLAAGWLRSHDKLTIEETDDLLRLLQKVQDAELEKSQARGLLFEMVRKTVTSMGASFRNGLSAVMGLFGLNKR